MTFSLRSMALAITHKWGGCEFKPIHCYKAYHCRYWQSPWKKDILVLSNVAWVVRGSHNNVQLVNMLEYLSMLVDINKYTSSYNGSKNLLYYMYTIGSFIGTYSRRSTLPI